jgi:hypothetical protein
MAAQRRRMPWMAVEKDYRFEGPIGPASLADLFAGRRQLIVYRAFYAPDVTTYPPGDGAYPQRACVGCSMLADQVAHPAHLNARDTTLAFVSRAPQAEIQGLKERMGWQPIPLVHAHRRLRRRLRGRPMARDQRLHPRPRPDLPQLLHPRPRRRAPGQHLELSRHHRARAPRGVGGLAGGIPTDTALPVVELPRRARHGSMRALPRGVPGAADPDRETPRRRGQPPGAAHRPARIRSWNDGPGHAPPRSPNR